MRRTILVSTALIAVTVAAPAFAQDSGSGATDQQFDTPRSSVTAGIGPALVPDYDGSDHYRVFPVPAVLGSVHGFDFSLVGNRASVNLIPHKPGPGIDFELGPVASINFNRTDRKSIDDPRVAALPERGTAIELGGYVGIGKTGVITSKYDKLSVSLSYRHDVNGVYHSSVWEPSITYLTPLSTKAAVVLFGSMDHVGRGYAQTYFGITPDDALTSGLPAYSAHGGWEKYTLGAAFTYSLTGNLLHGLKAVAGGTYSRMLNSASYSPVTRIAGSPSQWIGAVGLAYTF